MHGLLVLLLSAFLATPAVFPEGNSPLDCAATDVAGAAVKAARVELVGVRMEHDQTRVPPEAQRAIEALKDRIVGERVRRIHPVAFSSRDFIDEWMATDWEEARSWSAPSTALEAVHREMNAKRAGAEFAQFGSIRRCAPDLHEVELTREGRRSWYLLVRGKADYRLERATRAPAAHCKGPDVRVEIDKADQPWPTPS
ncbi:MAG TPA: hypothetical protein VF727_14675 [Allosphingosinicella sp.]